MVVVPVWQADEAEQKMVLRGFHAISDLLKRAQDVFLQDDPDKEVLWTYQAMNG